MKTPNVDWSTDDEDWSAVEDVLRPTRAEADREAAMDAATERRNRT